MLMMVRTTLAISLRTMLMIILNAHDPVLSPAPRRSSEPYDVKDRWGTGASYTEAVEDIYRYCKPMRFNADAPANDG